MRDKIFRILIIEDNPGDIALFREALEASNLNFEVDVIEDGSDALAFFEREVDDAAKALPSLVILDLWLPKANGETVLRAIRRSNRFSSVPVVITSSPPSQHQQAALEGLRIKEYFTKPSDVGDFLQFSERLKEILMETANPATSITPTVEHALPFSSGLGRL